MPRHYTPQVEIACEMCGNAFSVQAYRVKRARFCSAACRYAWQKTIRGERHPDFKGRYVMDGYVWVSLPDGGRTQEHRLVMEKMLGHPIPPNMHVHHIDGNRLNNDLANLMLLTPSEHATIHFTGKRIHRWSRNHLRCIECGGTDHPHQARGVCRRCYAARYNHEYVKPINKKRWSLRHDACVKCGRSDSIHQARGVCHRCYAQARYRERATSRK